MGKKAKAPEKRPRTIIQLQKFCSSHNMPLQKMRFYIGEDFKEPKAFGIYQDSNGNFVVYKNKANGERAIRYQGPDEAFAVRELYDKLKSETQLRVKNGSLKPLKDPAKPKETQISEKSKTAGSFKGGLYPKRSFSISQIQLPKFSKGFLLSLALGVIEFLIGFSITKSIIAGVLMLIATVCFLPAVIRKKSQNLKILAVGIIAATFVAFIYYDMSKNIYPVEGYYVCDGKSYYYSEYKGKFYAYDPHYKNWYQCDTIDELRETPGDYRVTNLSNWIFTHPFSNSYTYKDIQNEKEREFRRSRSDKDNYWGNDNYNYNDSHNDSGWDYDYGGWDSGDTNWDSDW